MTTGDAACSPVTITRATAQSFHRRYGYSKVGYYKQNPAYEGDASSQ